MEKQLERYKGIHPGLILEHELKKRHIAKAQFANSIHQKRQAINEITKGRRTLPEELTFKIDEALGYEQGTMLLMQTFYIIENHRKAEHQASGGFQLDKLRKGLFWDTDVNQLDWERNAVAIIRRVFERGNQDEKQYLLTRYSAARIADALRISTDELADSLK